MEILPSKPSKNKVAVKGNFFKFKVNFPINKYKVSITPELEGNPVQFFYRMMAKCRKHLLEEFTDYICTNFTIYSPKAVEQQLEYNLEEEDNQYLVTIVPAGQLDDEDSSIERLNFLGRFFKMCQNQLRLKMIGRKYFDPSKLKSFDNLKLEIWPGYQTSVKQYGNDKDSNILVNIDTSFKVIRQDSVLDYLKNMRGLNPDQIAQQIEGFTVMTDYNKRMYKVDRVAFDLSPKNVFKTNNESEGTTLIDYYLKRYNLKIRDENQPLLVHMDKKTGQDIFLIPEFCKMTGLDDKQRNDFQLMKKLSETTKPHANDRIQQTQQLIKDLSKEERSKMLLEKWKIEVEEDPLNISAQHLNPGNLIFGRINNNERAVIPIENNQNFDRQTQTSLYSQPELDKWAIYCNSRDREICDQFISTIQQCIKQYNYPVQEPKIIFVNSSDYNVWEKEMEILDESVTHVVLILPGPKKKAPLYDQLKRLLIEQKGVPSQVILTKTLQGKGIRSICNKVLVQICAKIGGIPWTIDNLPFSDQPTIVCAIDVYKRSGKNAKEIFSFVSTTDACFSKYFTAVKVQQLGDDIGILIEDCMVTALKDFYKINEVMPEHIIVYRDGIADNKRDQVEIVEVQSLRRAFKSMNLPNINLTFICINNETAAKFYLKGDSLRKGEGFQNLQNCPAGTLIDERQICSDRDFYLISQKINQGIASPTHYFVLVNDIADKLMNTSQKAKNLQELEMLTYKLCFQYFNWVGSIKIPAPVQYAHKLSNFVGDRWGLDFKVKQNFQEIKSLYFI